MALTEKQRTKIIVNYGDYDTLAELAFYVECELQELKDFMLEKNILPKPKKEKIKRRPHKNIVRPQHLVDKEEKTEPILVRGLGDSIYHEPFNLNLKFSQVELTMFEESLIDPVGIRIETINGKQCTIFQSRMNY